MARLAAEGSDDGTNDLIVSNVIRTNELQVWFVAEHVVEMPLVRRCRERKRKRRERKRSRRRWEQNHMNIHVDVGASGNGSLKHASWDHLACLLRHWTWANEAMVTFDRELATGWDNAKTIQCPIIRSDVYHWCALPVRLG